MSPIHRLTRLHRRSPTTFGPFPGPRQTFDGYTRNGDHSTSVEAFVTFRTTQSSIRSLLPEIFSFQESGNDAFVTIAPKELGNLEWLGGRGYRLLSVYIHGVRYVASDGRVYDGTYLPVVWEDLADPIVSGREELGYPKIFASLDIDRTETSYTSTASWMGTTFCHFELKNLKPASPQAESDVVTNIRSGVLPKLAARDGNLLLFRYIPAVGLPGMADAEYPVFVSADDEARLQKVITRQTFTAHPSEATFHWITSGARELPTLHHIVKRLADIPVLEVVACGLTEKRGGGDLSSARRIDSSRRSKL